MGFKKVPLTPKDLPTGHERLAQVSRKILMEMGDMLTDSKVPQLMVPRTKFTTKEGVLVYCFKKNENTLERRFFKTAQCERSSPFVCNLSALNALPLSLSAWQYTSQKCIPHRSRHGSIVRSHYANLGEALQASEQRVNSIFYAPPEVRKMDESPQQVFVDTYSVSMILFQSALDNKKGTTKLP